MAHEALAIVRLRSNTGIPADTVEMQFAFANCSENGGSGASAITAIDLFLRNGYGGAELSSFLAGSLDHVTLPEIDIYDVSGALGGGHRGSPVASGNLGTGLVTPTVDTDLPLQAAIGLSYHANLAGLPEFGATVTDIPTDEAAQDAGAPATHTGVSRPKASRRGRILFGPLNEGAMLSDSIRIRKPDTAFVNCAIGAMSDLAASTVGWSVWSRRTASFHQITGGWIADETDVVRRRRLKATTRSVWP